MELATFYKRIAENKFYTNESRLKFYLEEQLFKNINFKNKSLLDIGGGMGFLDFMPHYKVLIMLL